MSRGCVSGSGARARDESGLVRDDRVCANSERSTQGNSIRRGRRRGDLKNLSRPRGTRSTHDDDDDDDDDDDARTTTTLCADDDFARRRTFARDVDDDDGGEDE
jgi:hypothetical protein